MLIIFDVYDSMADPLTMQHTIYLGGGCFWCTEAVMQHVSGVTQVVSGYSGGSHDTATYSEVSGGISGHAEVIKVDWDETKVNLSKLLEVFFASHDPTTPGRQGADTGTQYRSVIFYTDENQKKVIEDYIHRLTTEKVFPDPIVTEVKQLKAFYPAEDYHQNFYNNNPDYGYCQVVINPKLQKLNQKFGLS